jgi:hypothetical protein
VSHKPGPFGRRLVADHGRVDLGVHAELGDNSPDQRQGGREVRTVLDMHLLDHQTRQLVVLQQRQHAPLSAPMAALTDQDAGTAIEQPPAPSLGTAIRAASPWTPPP